MVLSREVGGSRCHNNSYSLLSSFYVWPSCRPDFVRILVHQRTKETKHLRWPKELLKQHIHAPCHLGHQKVFAQLGKRLFLVLVPLLGRRLAEALRWRAQRRRIASPCHKHMLGGGDDGNKAGGRGS